MITASNAIFNGSLVSNAIEACGPGASMETILAHLINTPNSTIYDKAIDAVYNNTRIGGSLTHHIVDGHHGFIGALESASSALPNDTLPQEVCGTAVHLYKDLFSKMGLPLTSMTPDEYHGFSGWLSSTYGVSKSWVADLMQVNGMELFAAALSAAAIYFGVNHIDALQLFEIAGSLAIGGLIAGNPLSIICGALSLVLAWRIKKSGQSWSPAMLAFGRGLAATGAALALGSVLAGFAATGVIPAIITAGLVVVTGLAVRRFMGKPLPKIETSAVLSAELIRAACLKNLPPEEPESKKIIAEWLGQEFAEEYSRKFNGLISKPEDVIDITAEVIDTKIIDRIMNRQWKSFSSTDKIVGDIFGKRFADEYRLFKSSPVPDFLNVGGGMSPDDTVRNEFGDAFANEYMKLKNRKN
jgi:hypothetical protein